MTRICNFPISKKQRCTQPVADDKPNCGRHVIDLSADQLGQNPVIYKKGGELHVWAGEPDDVYCPIHSDPAYQALYQVAGEIQPCCLMKRIEHKDEHGKPHRNGGPAVIEADGTQHWYRHGELHRDDGPARVWPDGTQVWYQNGQRHREDGPAWIVPSGTQTWWQNGELHRDDGPAMIGTDGTQYWYQHDELHCGDGPAVTKADGTQKWYWHGQEITEEEHARLRAQSGGA